ncbi:MAG: hypothetical protein IJW76_06775 [Clostridia bacterium]|nr:hypothetical protein [Clostridia bacterium]
MSEKNFGAMNDAEFEEMLAEGIESSLPSEEVVELVSPWHKSVKRVLWGFALTLLDLQFLYLQYILPATGFFMLLFGLRALRKENKFFSAAYVLAWVRSVYFFSTLIINASAMHSDIYESNFMWVLAYINVLFTLATVYCFVFGFRGVLQKTGGEDGAKWLNKLAVWYTVFAVAAVISIQSTLIALAFMVCFVFIVVGIARVSRSLSWAGYAITPAKVRVSDKCLCAAVLGTVALGIALVYFFGAKYPMKWQAEENVHSAEAREVMAELEALGFPKDILADLTEEEILACRGAKSVYVESGEHALNDGRTVEYKYEENGIVHIKKYREYDVHELVMTQVIVSLPSEGVHIRSRLRVFHHFRFKEEAEYYGTELLDIVPLYYDEWRKTSDISGRVLYDGENTYTSPYYSLDETSVPGFFSLEPHIRAAFSLHKEGTNKRGYVSYEVTGIREKPYDSLIQVIFVHRTDKFTYPLKGSKDIFNTASEHTGFRKVQCMFTYYPELNEKE